jgi:hypothetical protein
MSYSALWLPDAIRSMGVEVVEVDGWQDRGHGDVDPQVYVSHHTADGPVGAVNSLGVVINGASYTAPGPLANILQSREPGQGNDKAYIIAAGTSYNAGTGGWNGVSGNNHTIGNEIEHTGTAPLPEDRKLTACKIAAGCLLAMGQPADNHCHHWEWSWPPGSKIDVCCEPDGQKCSGDGWRALTAELMRGGGPTPEPPPSRKKVPMAVVGHHWPDGSAPGDNDDWYAIDGGILLHQFGGDREVLGIPQEARTWLDDGAPITPLSDGDLDKLKARSGW